MHSYVPALASPPILAAPVPLGASSNASSGTCSTRQGARGVPRRRWAEAVERLLSSDVRAANTSRTALSSSAYTGTRASRALALLSASSVRAPPSGGVAGRQAVRSTPADVRACAPGRAARIHTLERSALILGGAGSSAMVPVQHVVHPQPPVASRTLTPPVQQSAVAVSPPDAGAAQLLALPPPQHVAAADHVKAAAKAAWSALSLLVLPEPPQGAERSRVEQGDDRRVHAQSVERPRNQTAADHSAAGSARALRALPSGWPSVRLPVGVVQALLTWRRSDAAAAGHVWLPAEAHATQLEAQLLRRMAHASEGDEVGVF